MKSVSVAVTMHLALVAAVAANAGPADPTLKCGRSAATTHYIIDGAFVDVGDRDHATILRGVDGGPDSVHSLEVLCWDPVRRVLQIGSGEPVVHVMTRTFVAALHEDMARIVTAQDAFHAKHGRFAATIAELDTRIVTPGLDVTITATEDGWHASAGGRLHTIGCHVYAGSIEPPATSPEAREPSCAPLPRLRKPTSL